VHDYQHPYTVCPACRCQYCDRIWPTCPRTSWHPGHGTDATDTGARYTALNGVRVEREKVDAGRKETTMSRRKNPILALSDVELRGMTDDTTRMLGALLDESKKRARRRATLVRKAAKSSTVQLTEDQFEEQYQHIPAKDGGMIRSWDELKSTSIYKIWSVVDGDDGGMYAMPGIHLVNNIGYLKTRKPWTGDGNITVTLDTHDEHGNIIEEG